MPGRSRYEGLPTATVTVDGRPVAYLRGRIPPDPATAPIARWHRAAPDDRLDLLAARYLGDPGAAWRICDANLVLDPDELVGEAADGRIVAIPAPGM